MSLVVIATRPTAFALDGPILWHRWKVTRNESNKFTRKERCLGKLSDIENTDFKKFDDMVREVLSGTPSQRQQLTDYLEALHQQKKLVYGIHPSSAAVMTCLVVDIQGEHYHFVDGADGGYAIAAKGMKAQMKALNL